MKKTREYSNKRTYKITTILTSWVCNKFFVNVICNLNFFFK